MSSTEVKIVLAAADVIARNGAKRTSMGDIAKAAEVSRQTLYDHFGTKSDLLLAVFEFGTERILGDLETAWDGANSVAEYLDIFFDISILAPFELFQKHPELADFLEGTSGPQVELARNARSKLTQALAARLSTCDHRFDQSGYAAGDIASFVVHVAKALKSSAATRSELEGQLNILKTSMLALAR